MSGSIRSRTTRSGRRAGRRFLQQRQAGLGVGRVRDAEAGALEVLAHHLGQAGVVFDHQELLHGGHGTAARGGPAPASAGRGARALVAAVKLGKWPWLRTNRARCPRCLAASVAQRPAHAALVFDGARHQLRRSRAPRRAAWPARCGTAWGVRPGDRVAWLGLNHPAQLVLLFALARLGAILLPLNFRLAPAEWEAVLARVARRRTWCTTPPSPMRPTRLRRTAGSRRMPTRSTNWTRAPTRGRAGPRRSRTRRRCWSTPPARPAAARPPSTRRPSCWPTCASRRRRRRLTARGPGAHRAAAVPRRRPVHPDPARAVGRRHGAAACALRTRCHLRCARGRPADAHAAGARHHEGAGRPSALAGDRPGAACAPCGPAPACCPRRWWRRSTRAACRCATCTARPRPARSPSRSPPAHAMRPRRLLRLAGAGRRGAAGQRCRRRRRAAGCAGRTSCGATGPTCRPCDAQGWFHTGDLAHARGGRQLHHRRPRQGPDHLRRREHPSGGDRGARSPLHPDVLECAAFGVPDRAVGRGRRGGRGAAPRRAAPATPTCASTSRRGWRATSCRAAGCAWTACRRRRWARCNARCFRPCAIAREGRHLAFMAS